jgi:hypothetical protein
MADEWGYTVEEWLLQDASGDSSKGPCYAAGMAAIEDGNFYSAAPTEGDAGWGMIFAEDYQANCLQEDGVTEKMLDVWEGDGLKTAITTGKKPAWGFYLGGTKYNMTQYQTDVEDNDNTFNVLLGQATKKGVIVASTEKTIVVGFYSEEKGQTAGNCKKAVLTFAGYLKNDCSL